MLILLCVFDLLDIMMPAMNGYDVCKAHLAQKETQNELEEWNVNLKKRLLQSVATIRKTNDALTQITTISKSS